MMIICGAGRFLVGGNFEAWLLDWIWDGVTGAT